MVIHSLKMVQKIPVGMHVVWAFFSNPGNILQLSPEYMDLQIIAGGGEPVIFPGQIIEYKVKPLWSIPVHWVTEIKEVEPGEFFIDVQKKGPYSMWEHRHDFASIEGGVEMTDSVRYQNPFGMLDKWANTPIVQKRLHYLFEFRFRKVEEIFGKWGDQRPLIHFS